MTKITPAQATALDALRRTVERATAKLTAAVATTKAEKPKSGLPTVTPVAKPKAPAAVALNSFGFTTAPGIQPATDARKAEADATKARRDALPAVVAPWSDRLDLAELEALAAVHRLYDANGRQPAMMPRADLAVALKSDTPDAAEAMLHRLAQVGAVERQHRLSAPDVFRPVAAPPPPQPSRKSATVTPTTAAKRPDPGALPRLQSALGLRR